MHPRSAGRGLTPSPFRNLKAVIFDLDGTLVDSYAGIAFALNAVLTSQGLPSRPLAEVRAAVGHGLEELLGRYLPSEAIAAGVERFRSAYAGIVLDTTVALPGAVETLRSLHERGIRVAVASNKPSDFSRRILEHLGVLPYIAWIGGPEDGIPPKPHPAMVHACLRALDATPEEAVYVGDMVLDVETALRAGVAVVLVPTGSSSRESLLGTGMPVVDRLDKLLDLFGAEPRAPQ